ncbi:uncharacterized protein LOC126833881 [Adelges cooleyi]|uniref:uncharacterized protein LOC126833881 n=1 Tax=Adelges cooleyi TaxID=133065 RepID=UPI00217FDBE3|nr:uncharacterized protein LOC126833881 [Adelges cooleyi]XP_050421408.1 uncharacterized protein LOC126833881 [Adelges cooleyi]XP_050421409.1 uncharacterized protein LOC126833881 [Adelges cooleyi]XP_050421410.1 uncharacterized protein LOC126833881 [Adelges cooleyi]
MTENSIVPLTDKEIYVTNAQYEGCFIKLWGRYLSHKKSNMEKSLQNYESFTKEMKTLDLFGNTAYFYIWKSDTERVYRCNILSSDLQARTHTIILIDYGQTMTVSFLDVREISMDISNPTYNLLTQSVSLFTFLLSGFIRKPKSNVELNTLLSNRFYKFRNDFDIGGVKFITLLNLDKQILVDSGFAEPIDITSTLTIANNLSSILSLNKKNGIENYCPVPAKQSMLSFLRSQKLDPVSVTNVVVTRVSVGENVILLTVRTIDYESNYLQTNLNAIDREQLVLAPVLEVHTPCLILVRNTNKLARAIILEVKINSLLVDLIDYGLREYVPRTTVFKIPSNFNVIEMRAMSVVLDKPNSQMTAETAKELLLDKHFGMIASKIDPSYGLYNVKLLAKKNNQLSDIFDTLNNGNTCSSILSTSPPKSPEICSIIELHDEDKIDKRSSYSPELSQSHNDKTRKSSESENYQEVNQKTCKMARIIIPIMSLQKEQLLSENEIKCKLLYYKSPLYFHMRQYNSNFQTYLEQINSTLESRCILKKNDIVKNMYVIYQNDSKSIYRAQVISMDSDIEKIELKLVDQGDEIVNEEFNKVTLYNFMENDCNMPAQLVLECSLSNMWFPLLNTDIASIIKPHFHDESLYTCFITGQDENGRKLVQLIENDTNINVSDSLLKSGIGQYLSSAMKTEESPYEENILKGQSFLSYILYSHFKLCIQPEPSSIDELEEEIERHINDNPVYEPMNLNNLQGTFCLATLSNDQWYRAYITNISDESIIVKLFDIGLLTDVSLTQIRPITSSLMKKPQLCLTCELETKNLNFKVTEKTLYNVTVIAIKSNGILSVIVNEHNSVPLPTPVVRGIEKISVVHVDGDVTYLQRVEDRDKLLKMSVTLSKINSKVSFKQTMDPGDMYVFESHGLYYRSVIKSISSKMVVVHCIDYGFEKQVEKKKLQYIGHTKVAYLPALAISVKTFPKAFNMINVFLANLHINSDGTINTIPYKTNSVLPRGDLIEMLRDKCLIKLTCVYSTQDCWIVPDMYFEKLNTISEALENIQSKVVPSVAEAGALCAALHPQTKKWNRALVLDTNKESDNILFIDSGERFKEVKTTKLASELQNIPNLAINCRIKTNVDLEQYINKTVPCKLLSIDQPLIEFELLLDDKSTKVETASTAVSWTVKIIKFHSLNHFYVSKVIDCNSSQVRPNDLLVEKLTYHCCVEEIDDCKINDPKNSNVISDILTSRSWTMKIMNNQQPFLVTLENNGQNCRDVIYAKISNKTLYDESTNRSSNLECHVNSNVKNIKLNVEKQVEYDNPSAFKQEQSTYTVNTLESQIVLPESECVIVKQVDTLNWFYVHSISLSELYKQRITNELDMCIIELQVNQSSVGKVVVTFSEMLGQWCRAVVEEIKSKESVYCYLLDFGLYEDCSQFYRPTEFLHLCPYLVRRCALFAPKLDGKEKEIWYSDVTEMFKDITGINGLKLDMTVKNDGSPCLITLHLEQIEISEMLLPMLVVVTQIESFCDFKVQTVSADLNTMIKILNNETIALVPENDPKSGQIYLAHIESKLKRVTMDTLGGIKYVVIDIDDTLDAVSVDCLYALPQELKEFPPFTLPCALILEDDHKKYSLNTFKKIAMDKREPFTMCILTETDGKSPNLVKLYFENRNIQDYINT